MPRFQSIFTSHVFTSLVVLLFCAVQAHADRNIIIQSTPSDCGPAALATLLSLYLDVPTTEKEMVTLTEASPNYGTTLLGLEKAAVKKGCEADSFRMTEETLRKQFEAYPSPVIVRTLNPEPHFSVLLGIGKDEVYLADPAVGNIMLSRGAFLKRWLLPGSKPGEAKEGYVFIAAAPDGYLNEGRRNAVLAQLATEKRNLQTTRPPFPLFRH